MSPAQREHARDRCWFLFVCACTAAHVQPKRVEFWFGLLAACGGGLERAAGKLEEAGEGILSAVHPRYLGHVADEPVERDVPATMRSNL